MARIRCVVERITYQNQENGYSILKVHVKGFDDLVTVVGSLLDANVGSVLLVDGEWKVDIKYGKQFLANRWEETVPATVYGIEKYLGSGLIKGVGPKFAKKIVDKYGTDTMNMIEDSPDRLIEVEGIGIKRVQMIKESWQKQKEVKNIMLFLQEYGISTSFAAKIYKVYGNESIERVKKNPFCLADDIWGIGFKTADSIGEKLGIEKNAYIRLRSGIMYTLSQLAEEGHVYAIKSQLLDTAVTLLETEQVYIESTIQEMLQAKDLLQEEEAIYLPPFYYAELGTASKLKKLIQEVATDKLWTRLQKARKESGNQSLSVDVSKIEEVLGIEYDQVQADAIRLSAMSKVMVLTGGPGTGKTTTTQGIIKSYQSYGLNILLAAPTGRAAKRLTETTNMEAKTIHRLLEYRPPEGYLKNEINQLEGDVLIVDECSMIDIILMNSLLKAIPPHMRLILVGDIDQLPSVGAGNVLMDIMESNVVEVVRLTKIFRQAQTSRIIMNAHRINEGKLPDISNGKDTDFFFIEKMEAEDTLKEVVRLVSNNLPKHYGIPSLDIQVLTPMQRGVMGTMNLNLVLQEALNPNGEGLRRSGSIYRLNDKVMQVKNNYDKEVFNGDMGKISQVNLEDRSLCVDFDGRLVEYELSDLDEIVHGYATTIHKAQGSEYPIVIMPVLMNHYMMLQRNLIYTGITRAKKVCIVIGTKKALSYGVYNVTVKKRNTLLRERLNRNEIKVMESIMNG